MTGPATHFAAIDLGSNSFHLIVAREVQAELRPVDRSGEKVQLAAGLDENRILSEEAMERGWSCLTRFAQLLNGFPESRVRVVATNTLRAARNRQVFIDRAEEILGVPVELISGREEARLIYLGVAHSISDDEERRLVVDIGGGSTELIIGERFTPMELESLHMGSVSYTKRFFANGKIGSKQFRKAVNAARLEIQNIRRIYRSLGWSDAVGASGTIKAAMRLANNSDDTTGKLTLKKLETIRDQLIETGSVSAIRYPFIKEDRATSLPGGIAVLIGLFESLGIDSLRYSEGALREGLLYDMSGRKEHEDVRERTVAALMQRYHVDRQQAEGVCRTALGILSETAFDNEENRELLAYAARLHEVGLAISHSQFQKHGAYIIAHSDLMGFTQMEQDELALLVLAHRRKLPRAELDALRTRQRKRLLPLILVLRLAVLLNRGRYAEETPLAALRLDEEAEEVHLRLPENWLAENPLTADDLEQEAGYLKTVGLRLCYC